MEEVSLEALNDWYIEKLNQKYFKHKRNLKKLLEKVEKNVIELKHAVDQMNQRKDEIELDEKSILFVDRFYKKVKESVDELEIPDEPMAEDVSKLIESIKKVFLTMNEAGRKNIPRFAEQFKIELKSIDMITRKISEQMASIDGFIRKKYSEVKEAEAMLKKIPRLQNIVERIENAKKTVDSLNQQFEDLNTELSDLENRMLELEAHPLFKEKSELDKDLMNIRMKLDDNIKFKKALKKLKKKVEKSGNYKGLTSAQVKKYLSNTTSEIIFEGENHPGLTDFLVQLRYLIETDSNALQLKSDVVERILENIDQIVSKNILREPIKEYIEKDERVRQIDKELEKENLISQLEEIKSNISMKTQSLEHFGGDLKNKQNEYRGLLEKLKEDREELQTKVKEYVGEDVKLNITLNF